MIDALLVFPPFWEPTQPYLSLPALTAWLRQQGHSVRQWDLNLHYHDTVISSAYLQQLLSEQSPTMPSLMRQNVLKHFVPKVDQAKAILRSARYYEPADFIEAKTTLEKAYQLLNWVWPETRCSRRGLIMRYRESSSAELLLASEDRASNPYLGFYEAEVLPQITAMAPRLVGISIADTTQLIGGLSLARLLRKQLPQTHITLGGALFSKFAEAISQQPEPALTELFHSMVSGEGELPLLKLLEALKNGDSFEQVPGLVYLDSEGQVQRNEAGLPIPMNELPPPDFDDLELARYWVPEPILPLLGSKDCYWKECSFCDHYVSYAPRYRLRKPALMAADMLALQQKYGVRQFSFGDETLSPNYARRLASALIESGADLRWSMLSRLQKEFDAAICELIRAGGCSFIMYGLESAHPRTIERMAKGTQPETAAAVYRATDAAGIYNYSFVFFGFPGETRAEAQVTVDFIKTHAPILHSIGAGFFMLQRFAPVFRERERYGIVSVNAEDLADDWGISLRYEVAEGMSQAEATRFYLDFMQQLQQIYGMPLWLVDNSRSTLLLYINHHGKDWMQSYDFSGQANVSISV
ncbi:MAG: radical SAM protein [Candidatus Sericytochromatia bacterium]|nr:radical SAM protein [Candidatus Sericytochromatia bacterium]